MNCVNPPPSHLSLPPSYFAGRGPTGPSTHTHNTSTSTHYTHFTECVCNVSHTPHYANQKKQTKTQHFDKSGGTHRRVIFWCCFRRGYLRVFFESHKYATFLPLFSNFEEPVAGNFNQERGNKKRVPPSTQKKNNQKICFGDECVCFVNR